MTDKRFHYHIDEVGIYYYICDGGKTEDKIFAEVIGDVEEVTDKLNELHEENQQVEKDHQRIKNQLRLVNERNYYIQNCITEAMQRERTQIGKSVLRQLMEAIE